MYFIYTAACLSHRTVTILYCVTLDELFDILNLPFPQNGDKRSVYFIGWFWELMR